ncbi:Oxysterol-binding protein-like protein [Zancudomyces culisetae]|uniref:Oxysterol-binding protein-like protein n=1 Tax=Zancudomyces culisetae TaxID=1213189 RepID=A0A1R1PE43_ZANCU|nr:Oxysterol-binding protein-like protein [Zancudomyces culisetae]|eukprot:OMH79173.1 Oxysterol-binding protein-like protein [Zancudomyces culisetae]
MDKKAAYRPTPPRVHELNAVNEEELEEGPRNIILSMIAQLGTNLDLSRVTLPTFVLEPRSFTERITDFMTYPDILLRAIDEKDPIERFMLVCKYYMAGWRTHPKVSHHPPISAFTTVCPKKGLYISGELRPKGRFQMNTVVVTLGGNSTINFLKHNEKYEVTYPSMYARGILVGKMVIELGGKATIKCEKNDLIFKVDFKTRGFFGGEYNQISAKVCKMSTDATLYEIYGDWQHVLYYKKKSASSEAEHVFFDSNTEQLRQLVAEPIENQNEFESRRLWNPVTLALKVKNLDKATEEKTKIENLQREMAKEREAKKIEWVPKYFTYNKASDSYSLKLLK